jgi:hypothetical protein
VQPSKEFGPRRSKSNLLDALGSLSPASLVAASIGVLGGTGICLASAIALGATTRSVVVSGAAGAISTGLLATLGLLDKVKGKPATGPRLCAACGFMSLGDAKDCRRCGSGNLRSYSGPAVVSEQPSGPRIEATSPCPKCEGERVHVFEKTNQGAGCIVFLLGLLFAPFCVGIAIMVVGLNMMNEGRAYWHCRGCGTTFPV